ncbi:MAG TPA: hypothetical protein VEH82_04395 [Acidimicrobiales bacterium]|nr:hypothetical protein [Acidimicrobiales bacterium]
MTPTPTTIHDVWIHTKQRRRKPDVFDLSLSTAGIVVLRPGRAGQHLGWDRISDCEIEKRQGYLLLILRGGGSTTRLVVTGWSFEDLDAVLQEARRGSTAPESDNGSAAPAATPAATPATTAERDSGDARATKAADPAQATKAARATKAATAPTTARTAEATGAAGVAAVAKAHRSAGATKAAGAAEKAKAAEPAAAAEVAPPEPAWADTELADALAPEPTVWQRVPWKPVVTVVLLGLLVFAVIVVLLQSAGLIDWGFLGPTA